MRAHVTQIDEDANKRIAQGYLNVAATHRLQGQHKLAAHAVWLAQRYDPSARGGAAKLKNLATATAPAVELPGIRPRHENVIAIFTGTLIAAVIIAIAAWVWP